MNAGRQGGTGCTERSAAELVAKHGTWSRHGQRRHAQHTLMHGFYDCRCRRERRRSRSSRSSRRPSCEGRPRRTRWQAGKSSASHGPKQRRGIGAEGAATPVLADSEYWRSGSGVAPGTHPDATRIMCKIATIFAINTNCAILRDLAPNFGRNPGAPKFRKTLREILVWGKCSACDSLL